MMVARYNPFALSLSKCAYGLEASFDRLRTNGMSTNGNSRKLTTNGISTNGLSTSLETNGGI
ncbi:MAG: hypothetical protein ACI91C_001914 [Burkholderiaceae bacterium]|jgi:hypothetical protein